jgi:hypothetical protein
MGRLHGCRYGRSARWTSKRCTMGSGIAPACCQSGSHRRGGLGTTVLERAADARGSEVAMKEIAHAAALNKRFAPIVYQRVEDRAMPPGSRTASILSKIAHHGQGACDPLSRCAGRPTECRLVAQRELPLRTSNGGSWSNSRPDSVQNGPSRASGVSGLQECSKRGNILSAKS